MGDFNLPGINWRDYSHPSNEILDEMGFHQFVQLPTRQANILDLLLSNQDIKTMPPICQTDHNTKVFKANLPSQPITVYGYGSRRLTQSAYEILNNYFCETSWNDLFQYCLSVDDCWRMFINIVRNRIDRIAPEHEQPITTTGSTKPSYHNFILKAQTMTLLAFRKWHSCGRIEDKILKKVIKDHHRLQ